MEKLREEVVSNLRACLISTKGKLDVRTLRRDYKTLVGEDIPYVKLGHRNLEEFLMTVDSLTTCRGPSGEMLIDAKGSKETAHLTDMINRQKSTKKKLPTRHLRQFNFSNHHHHPASQNKWRPKNINTRVKQNYDYSSRPAAVSHSQFVAHSNTPKKPTVPSKIVRPPAQPVTSNGQNKENESVPPVSNAQKKSVERHDPLLNTKKRIVQKMSSLHVEQDTSETRDTKVSHVRSKDFLKKYSSELTATDSNLYQEAMNAVDPSSPLWSRWTSDESSSISSGDERNGRNGFPIVRHKAPEFVRTGNHIVDLENFIQHNGLPEMKIKVIHRNMKRNVFYDCNIKVGKHSYSSYPTDFTDETLCRQYTAQIALDDLMTIYGRRHSMLLSHEKDILERIPPMVQKHSNGIWKQQLEADYADIYNEQLPINWLEIVDLSANIYVEMLLDNRFILRYCEAGEVFQKGNKIFSPLLADVSVASNTVTFSDDGTLSAIITCAVSAAEIWCRQFNTPESEAFERLSVSLENHYTQHGPSLKVTTDLTIGGYYVVQYETSWMRVRVLEFTKDEISCFCIDYGDEYTTSRDNIYQLKREYAIQQAQAFVCRLAGLEELYETSRNSESVQNLTGKAVQLEMSNDEHLLKMSPVDPSLCIIMRDLATGICINEELISLISIESATPFISQNGVTEAYVSHVEDNGDIYIQIHSQGFEKLESLLEDLEKTIAEQPNIVNFRATRENCSNRLFFAQYKDDNRWYRVKVIDWAPNDQYAQLYFVDYGNTSIIKVTDETLYPIDELSDVICKYPYQALKVRMDIAIIPKEFMKRVKEIMPDGRPILVRLIKYNEENVPLVEFFKRTEPDNLLFSVNAAILMDTDLNRHSPEDGNNNATTSAKIQRLISLNQFEDGSITKNFPSAGSLSPPEIPKLGEFYDVTVPCAVNPWNFFVQPYATHDKLNKLMSALQERYKDVVYSPLQIDDIKPGKIYASKHEDGWWYRTSVIKVIHAGSISVFYCDFGYYANLTRQQLIPLDFEFTTLPYQAIKAKMMGIKPKHTKWTMEDCKFFTNLVLKKPFVSILGSIEKDELYRSDTVLCLKLIDTSTSEDVYIDKVLVKKGIAVEC